MYLTNEHNRYTGEIPFHWKKFRSLRTSTQITISVVLALLVIGFITQGPSTESRINNLADAITKRSVDTFIPDEIVAKMLSVGAQPSHMREYIYREKVCNHILRYSSDDCLSNITRETTEKIQEFGFRAEITNRLRQTYSDPAALRDLYYSRKDGFLEAFARLPFNEKRDYFTSLEDRLKGMKAFDKGQIAHVHQQYLLAQQGKGDQSFTSANDALYEEMASYNANGHESLRGLSFAFRRQAEGGSELVVTYIEIMNDLYVEIDGNF